MQKFSEDEVSYIESLHLHLQVEISSCTPLIRCDSELRIALFRRSFAGSHSVLGCNSFFIVILLRSQLGPWPHICLRVRMGFYQLSTCYKPIVPRVAHQPIFPSGLQVSSSVYA